MKKILGLILISITLFMISNSNNTDLNTVVREVELSTNEVDYQSVINEFDEYEYSYEESKITFTGLQTIDATELFEIDFISDNNLSNKIVTKYDSSYDYENGIVSLSVSLVDGEEITVIDTIFGVIVSNDSNEFDVVFDVEGEILLLSELEDNSSIENCGFFSKLKKVWNTTAGKIGTIVTVAACVTVGVVCAVIPGGQLVTAVALGAAVGAVGGGITAGIATYQIDGKIDWAAVGCYAGAGAIVGGVASAASFKLTAAIKNSFPKAKPANDMKSFDTYTKFKSEYGKASDYVTNGEWHHIVEQQTVTKGINSANSIYNSKNTVAIPRELHIKITSYYNSLHPTAGITNRAYINSLPYEQQYVEGLKILAELAKTYGGEIIWF